MEPAPEVRAFTIALVAGARPNFMKVAPVYHAMAAGSLPGPHRDPFDRMLIAQSRLEDLPVVTADPVFRRYSTRTVW